MHPNQSRRLRLEAARLYAVTADADPERVVEVAAALLRGGVDVLQLRQKSMARGDLYHLAERLAPLAHQAGALFIVNDHADIAALSGADGVHVGPDDIPVEAARRVLGGDLLVGASASSPEAGRAAAAAGADYLGSGPAFPTPVKTEKAVIGPEGSARVAAAVEIPVFAIGGIDLSNLPLVTAAGLRRVCMIRALFEAEDAAEAARQACRLLSQ